MKINLSAISLTIIAISMITLFMTTSEVIFLSAIAAVLAMLLILINDDVLNRCEEQLNRIVH